MNEGDPKTGAGSPPGAVALHVVLPRLRGGRQRGHVLDGRLLDVADLERLHSGPLGAMHGHGVGAGPALREGRAVDGDRSGDRGEPVEGAHPGGLLLLAGGAVGGRDQDLHELAVAEGRSGGPVGRGHVHGASLGGVDQVGLGVAAVADGVEVLARLELGGTVRCVGSLDGDALRGVGTGGPRRESAQLGDQGVRVRGVVEGAAAGLRHAGELVARRRVHLEPDHVDVQVEPLLRQVASHLARITAARLLAVGDQDDGARAAVGQIGRGLFEAVGDRGVAEGPGLAEGGAQRSLVGRAHRDDELRVLAGARTVGDPRAVDAQAHLDVAGKSADDLSHRRDGGLEPRPAVSVRLLHRPRRVQHEHHLPRAVGLLGTGGRGGQECGKRGAEQQRHERRPQRRARCRRQGGRPWAQDGSHGWDPQVRYD